MILIPFGKYTRGDSIMHRIDPRIKLIGTGLLVSVALITDRWIGLLPLIFTAISANYAAKTPLHQVTRDIKSLAMFYFITLLLHSILGSGEPLLKLPLGITITVDGIMRGVFFTVKIILLVTLIGPMMRTTHPEDWQRAIETLQPGSRKIGRILNRFAVTLGLAIRFLPMLLAEAERIRWAQIGRGLDFGGGIINRTKNLVPLIVPLVNESLHKTDLVTAAMRARGFRLDAPRTHYKPLKLKMIDLWTTVFVLFAVILAVV